MTYSSDDKPRWAGWYRPPRGRWRRLPEAEAGSFSECWGRLLEAARRLPAGDTVVLQAHRHPGDKGGKGR